MKNKRVKIHNFTVASKQYMIGIYTYVIKTNTFFCKFLAFIEQKEKDNNDNLYKFNGGLYIASALIKLYLFLVPKQCKVHHGFYIYIYGLSLLSFSFCSIEAMRPKICKKSVCFYCITTSLWRTPCSESFEYTYVYIGMLHITAPHKFILWSKIRVK